MNVYFKDFFVVLCAELRCTKLAIVKNVRKMSGNTEPTSNSMKFTPMPMSALLANLMLQPKQDSHNCSFSSGDESDNSFDETVAKKPSPAAKLQHKYIRSTNKDFYTPNVKCSQPNDIKAFASEKKPSYDVPGKENVSETRTSSQTHPNKENLQPSQSVNKVVNKVDDVKRNVFMPQNNNVRTQSTVKETPDSKPIIQKPKSATPKIKSGIRKFTPGSARKSQKKTPQKAMIVQNRDRVRCELFSSNQQRDEPSHPSTKMELKSTPAPVPETPLNRKPLPPTYAATPSYPQGVMSHHSKILFKTTSIKDKKYMFIKMLGKGGSSEVYKVSSFTE